MSYKLKSLKKFAIKNMKTLMANSTFVACIAEQYSAHEDGDIYVNKHGYDQQNPKTKKRKEVKFTNKIQKGNCLRISSIEQKSAYDILKIADGVNDRKFEIPRKMFQKYDKLYSDGSFWWSATYNEEDDVQVNNTNLLLKYEVV